MGNSGYVPLQLRYVTLELHTTPLRFPRISLQLQVSINKFNYSSTPGRLNSIPTSPRYSERATSTPLEKSVNFEVNSNSELEISHVDIEKVNLVVVANYHI